MGLVSGSLEGESARLRAEFPALESGFVFLENAGGSQVPQCVIDRMAEFMRERYVQLGAGYLQADLADQTLLRARTLASRMFNAEGIGEVVLGPSTSQLIANLASAVAVRLQPGDEVIVSVANHEANAGPWMRLAERGVIVKLWTVGSYTGESTVEELREMLTERTRIVAFPHSSNLLGDILPVAEIADAARQVGARTVVDGVAFAPHRAIDVAAWGCDFYVYSAYKVYGPHVAAMCGRHEAWAEIDGPNHFFHPRTAPTNFELGCLSYEGWAGFLATGEYLSFAAGTDEGDQPSRATIERAFDLFQELETPVRDLLVEGVRELPVWLLGPSRGRTDRHPTVSFVPKSATPEAVVDALHARNIGCRSGHMYAYRLCEALGIRPEPGVVRISAVHTNTVEEIEKTLAALRQVIGA